MTDGSSNITFRDPDDFQPRRTIEVKDGDRAVHLLNELEWVEGKIYVNVWHSWRIAIVAPETGAVEAWIDLSGIIDPALLLDSESVLNGIAWDPASKRLLVTGKNWPKLFEISVVKTQ